MSQPERIFIGWETSLSRGVASQLLTKVMGNKTRGDGSGKWRLSAASKEADPSVIDLGEHLVIVPSAFAERLIREELARQSGSGVLLPRIETAERFLNWGDARMGVASRADVLMAWLKVLVGLDCGDYPVLFPANQRGDRLDYTDALSLAEALIKLRDTLGGSELGHTIRSVCELGLSIETKRWEQLALLEDAYIAALGPNLRDHNAIRAMLAKEGAAPEGIRHIWVAALPDPQPLLIAALRRLAEKVDIHVLVGAGAEDAAAFDDWGRPVPAVWHERRADWKDFTKRVHLVGDPADGLRKLEQLLGKAKPAVGLHAVVACDREADAPRVAATIRSMGAEAVNPLGSAHGTHMIHQALATWAGLLGDREPDFAWLQKALNNTHVAKAAAGVTGVEFSLANRALSIAEAQVIRGSLSEIGAQVERVCAEADKEPELNYHLRKALVEMIALLEPVRRLLACRDELGKGGWHESFGKMLGKLAPNRRHLQEDNPDDAFTLDVLMSLEEAAEELRVATARLGDLPISREDHIRLVLSAAAPNRFRRPESTDSINLPGWVEAPWEPVPHLVVFGLNDELIPRVALADPFLPAGLRNLIGLPSNEQAFATAAFCFEQLWRQRQNGGRLDVVVPQTDSNGDPRRPSRILFLGPDEHLTERVLQLFKESPEADAQPYWEIPQEHKFVPARSAKEAQLELTEISATDFKHYLCNPTEFWMRKKLGMDSPRQEALEMSAANFGNLIHAAVEAFGHNWLGREDTDGLTAEAIRSELDEYLEAYAHRVHGATPSPSVLIQINLARQRVGAFAKAQALLFNPGPRTKDKRKWIIMAVEGKLPPLKMGPDPKLGLGTLTVKGRFDRLDYCKETKEWRVYDYKTFGQKATPSGKHLKGGKGAVGRFVSVFGEEKKPKAWVDLQLPAYVACLEQGLKLRDEKIGSPGVIDLPKGAKVQPAYFCMPAQAGDTSAAEWKDYHKQYHEEALKQMQAVIAGILKGEFLPEDTESEYPILPGMAGRRMADYMDLEALKGGAR